MAKLTPKQEAYAFRIWAALRKGPATIREVAETINIPLTSAREVIRLKGWRNRFRSGHDARRSFGERHIYDTLDEMR